MTDLIEKYAIIMAEGNNGGTWATHYTDSQKDFWRARAEKLIEDIKMNAALVHAGLVLPPVRPGELQWSIYGISKS
jgi:hypothetical protein